MNQDWTVQEPTEISFECPLCGQWTYGFTPSGEQPTICGKCEGIKPLEDDPPQISGSP